MHFLYSASLGGHVFLKDYKDLTHKEKQQFGKMVNQLRKQGYDVATAQKKAYSELASASMNNPVNKEPASHVDRVFWLRT